MRYSLMQLAGRQILPNTLLALALQRCGRLHKHVVLHTDSVRDSLEPARQLLSLLPDDGVAEHLMQEVNALASHTYDTALALIDEDPQARWLLHATGGNKLMSLGLQALARHPRVEGVIYCDIQGGWLRVGLDANGTPYDSPLSPADPLSAILASTNATLDSLALEDVVSAQFAAEDTVARMRGHPITDGIDVAQWLDAALRSPQGFRCRIDPHTASSFSGDGAAFECWAAHVLHTAGARRVRWGMEAEDATRSHSVEIDVIASHGNSLLFCDVKLERRDASGKTAQLRIAHDTAGHLGGLSARCVVVRPNWPGSPTVVGFARALGIQLVHRNNLADLVPMLCRPLGLAAAAEENPKLRATTQRLKRELDISHDKPNLLLHHSSIPMLRAPLDQVATRHRDIWASQRWLLRCFCPIAMTLPLMNCLQNAVVVHPPKTRLRLHAQRSRQALPGTSPACISHPARCACVPLRWRRNTTSLARHGTVGNGTDRDNAALRWHLVTRHPGALAWLQRHARPGPVFVHTHLDRLEFDAGDIVCGVLPVHLMARINQLGARVAVIEMDVPADLRGRELSPEELDAVGARLVEYRAKRLAELVQDVAVSMVHPAAPLLSHHDARDPPVD